MSRKYYHKVFKLHLKVQTTHCAETDDMVALEDVRQQVLTILQRGLDAERELGATLEFKITAIDVDPPTPPETLEAKVDRIERVINAMARRERNLLKVLTESIPERWR